MGEALLLPLLLAAQLPYQSPRLPSLKGRFHEQQPQSRPAATLLPQHHLGVEEKAKPPQPPSAYSSSATQRRSVSPRPSRRYCCFRHASLIAPQHCSMLPVPARAAMPEAMPTGRQTCPCLELQRKRGWACPVVCWALKRGRRRAMLG